MIDDLIRQVALLQRQVDGLIKPETGRLMTWTATVSQGGAVSIGSQTSQYYITGPLVWVHSFINISGSGSAGTAISVGGQPTIIQTGSGQAIIGEGRINDVSATDYQGLVYVNGATDWSLRFGNGGSYVGAFPSFALANGDTIEFNCIYRRV